MTNPEIEKTVEEFERRVGGFIATESKRENQDKDNEWLRNKLQQYGDARYNQGKAVAFDEEAINCVEHSEYARKEGYQSGQRDMQKRCLETIKILKSNPIPRTKKGNYIPTHHSRRYQSNMLASVSFVLTIVRTWE